MKGWEGSKRTEDGRGRTRNGESGEVGIVMKLIDLVSLYHWA